MGINLLEGRGFIREFNAENAGIIVNTKFLEKFNISDPIGKTIDLDYSPSQKIIGVVNNFNYSSLTDEIEPSVINMTSSHPFLYLRHILVKTKTSDLPAAIDLLEKNWKMIRIITPI